MKILAIANRIPAIGKKGDQIVAYNRLIFLADHKYKIELICFGDRFSEATQRDVEKLEKHGIIVHLFKLRTTEKLLNLALNLFKSEIPFQAALFKSRRVIDFVKKADFDLVYCVTLRSGLNFYSELPYIVDLVDSMGLNYERKICLYKNRLIKWLLTIEKKRLSIFEKNLAEKSKKSFVVSKIDASYINSSKISIIPLGVGEEFIRSIRGGLKKPLVIFSGNMNYRPNHDAVLWFINSCWRKIKNSIPDAELKIVGNQPSRELLRLTNDENGIFVVGHVSSVANELSLASVSIAPMKSGSGMQFKILEAMACKAPVVATKLALGDIKAEENIHILLADSADEFSEKVIILILKKEIAKEISYNAYNLINKAYTWRVVNENFIREIRSLN